MPTKWPGASWLRSTLERPFPRLVAHFAASIFEGETAADDADMGVGGVLGLLFVPGAFLSILLFDKYSTLLQWLRGVRQFNIYTESLPDKYFFIVFSMAITGVVVVLKWDRILPGPRDYANLAPLPISARRIFAANLLAILILAMVFAFDVNAASIVLYPMGVVGNRGTVGEILRFGLVHGCCLMLASFFAFLACFSIMSALMALLPYRAFRSVSLYLRVLIVVALVTMLVTSFAVPDLVRHLPDHPEAGPASTRLVPGSLPITARPRDTGTGQAQPRCFARGWNRVRRRPLAVRVELPPLLHANFGIERRPAVPPPHCLQPTRRLLAAIEPFSARLLRLYDSCASAQRKTLHLLRRLCWHGTGRGLANRSVVVRTAQAGHPRC